MGYNYGGLFEDWEVAIAVRLAKDAMVKYECLRWADEAELVQECLMHWYVNEQKYDPCRGASRKTFMAQIVRNKLRDIVQGRMAQKRGGGADHLSLDEPLGTDEDSRTREEETAEDGRSDWSRDYAAEADLRLDVTSALESLTERQRRICDLLTDADLTMTDVAREAGIHRCTLYEEIARIRRRFAQRGLGDDHK